MEFTTVIMTVSEKYNEIKKQIILSCNTDRHEQLLSTLKDIFRNNINSPRRFEQIKTIGQLLTVLEIRDVLSEYNIGPLKEIANRIHNNIDLLQSINEYENSQISMQNVNCYVPESTHTVPIRKQADSFFSNNLIDKKKYTIIKTVTQDIGIFWRDLARNLNIKERDIDNINENYREISLKAKHIMDLFLDIADCQTWFYDLCEALELSRRKDLAKKLKKISVMNI